jgi:hypothetical protein
MNLHWSDWTRACLAASVLLGLAAFAVLGLHHGFEEQVGWYVGLLPGAFFAAAFSDLAEKTIPRGNSIVFWVLLVCFNFLWYFIISYAAIKTYRFFSEALKHS